MKYVVLGLIIILMATGGPTRSAEEQMAYDGVASANEQRADGVTTVVSIHVQAREGTTTLALSIRRFQQSCGQGPACATEGLFTSSGSLRIPAADATIDRQLAWGSLHTRVAVFDTVSNASEDVRLDVGWTATDGLSPVPHGIGQAFYRDATVRGMITSRLLGTVALQSTDPGTLSRHLDG